MDTHPLITAGSGESAATGVWALLAGAFHVAAWLVTHVLLLSLVGLALWIAWGLTVRYLTLRALASRTAVAFTAAPSFETDAEGIHRQGMQLIRAAGAGKWWAPRGARTVRVRMRADGEVPLTYQVEGPRAARRLLTSTPYARVRTGDPRKADTRPRKHEVRAVFVLHGDPAASLRDVPLDPDPLQPLLDAVSVLRADQGDAVELCLDLSPASRWGMAARRWQMMQRAREKARRETQREARWMAGDAAAVEDSLVWQMRRLLAPGGGRSAPLVAPRPPRVDAATALGKLDLQTGVVRAQLLVRCVSDQPGEPELLLRQVTAALDVFAARPRWSSLGWSVGPFRYGPDRWPWRKSFDLRWRTGLIKPGRDSWVTISELAGLLKPPTRFARQPVLASALPEYAGTPKDKRGLLPQGYYRGPDGIERLIATREAETLFEIGLGKAGWGKTERALVQAVAHAHDGGGMGYVDPHRDTWPRVMPYLAHNKIMGRIIELDLTSSAPGHKLPSLNVLSMQSMPPADQVVTAAVDAFASSLGWADTNTPRALTIFTKSIEALVAVNEAAVTAGRPQAQATLWQIRPLLTDALFRAAVVGRLLQADPEAGAWWTTEFATFGTEALPTVLNPLARLSAVPQIRAFLGQPVSTYDARHAMDNRQIVWICPPGTGPTNRLLVSLLLRDILRATLSRRDTDQANRHPWRLYLDELISLDDVAGEVLAEIVEQARKFGLRLHGMTQLLDRISPATRTSLLQNASTLSSTSGSMAAIRHMTEEWQGRIEADQVIDLPRFHHYASFTIGGERVGPLLLRGAALEEAHAKLARPRRLGALRAAVATNSRARPLAEMTKATAGHTAIVLRFLTGGAVSLIKQPAAVNSTGTDEGVYNT